VLPITFTMCAMSQHFMRVVGQDKGRGVAFVSFRLPYEIPDDIKDPRFIDHVLRPEFAGILRWLVDGAVMHQDTREELVMPEEYVALLAQYKDSNDHFSAFVEECLVVKHGAFVTQEQLYAAAAEWGTKNRAQALVASSKQNFITMFATCALTKNKVKDGRKTMSDGTKPRGFVGVELSNKGARSQYGKGDDRQLLTRNQG